MKLTKEMTSLLTSSECQPPKGLVFDPKEFLNQPEDWTRNKLAFDKCTLLSSQGSDAPNPQSHDQAHRGNFSILSVPPRLSNQHAESIKTRSATPFPRQPHKPIPPTNMSNDKPGRRPPTQTHAPRPHHKKNPATRNHLPKKKDG